MHSRRLLYAAAFAVFLLILLALHYRAFHAPLYYDSTNLQGYESAFTSGDLTSVITLFPQRPIAILSFYLSYLFSGLNPAHFRMVNAVLMAGMALLVVAIIVKLLEISDSPAPSRITERRVIAACLGLFLVAHPVQTFLVLYIWQRMALLSAFFYCAAFLAYLVTRTAGFKRKWPGYAFCAVLYVLAMASKENAVTFPVVVILAEIAFFKIGWKTALKQAVLLGAAAVLMLGIFSFLERPHGDIARASGVLATIKQYYVESEQTPLQVIINQSGMLSRYLALILFPTPDAAQLISPQIPYKAVMDSPAAIAGVISAMVFLGLGLLLLRTRPLAGFGMLFFFINLLPEGLLVPQYLFIPYRATLPMVGILFVAADGLGFVLGKARERGSQAALRVALATGFVAGLCLMTSVTVIKARTWQDPLALWGDVVSHLPADYSRSEKAGVLQSLNSLGVNLQQAGRNSEALTYHLQAVKVAPKYYLTYLALGNAYAGLGETEQAEQAYRDALEVAPKNDLTCVSLGNVFEGLAQKKHAEQAYRNALKARSDSDKAHVALASLLIAEDRNEEARVHLRQALAIAPHNPEYHNLMGALCLKQDNNVEALTHLGKAIDLKPNYGEAHFHLGKLFSRMGRTSEAASQFAIALELEPNHWQAHNDFGIILAKAGRVQEAIFHFHQALKANPEEAAVKANLANALRQLNSVREK